MTTHYIDLTVVPDPESGVPALLGTLYDRLHLALVQQELESIGVSFPGYSMVPRSLGTKLRLHGSEASLRQLFGADWLKGMRDHVRMTGIAPAPVDAPHRVVQRKQFKTSADRLRRRRMKRKGETAAQAQSAIPSSVERTPNLPYVHVRSRSTGQPFCLFIALGPPSSTAVSGIFSRYGLGGSPRFRGSDPFFASLDRSLKINTLCQPLKKGAGTSFCGLSHNPQRFHAVNV